MRSLSLNRSGRTLLATLGALTLTLRATETLVPVAVQVKPDSAQVFIDGAPRGGTPLAVSLRPAIPIRLRVVKPGYLEYETTFIPSAEQVNVIERTLTPTHPGVYFVGAPGIRVEVFGPPDEGFRLLGEVNGDHTLRVSESFVPGRYQFRFARTGFQASQLAVDLSSNAAVPMEINVPELVALPTRVEIYVLPAAEELLIDNRAVRFAGVGPIEVPPGRRLKLTVRARGYEEKSIEVPAPAPGVTHRADFGQLKESRGSVILKVVDASDKPVGKEFFAQLSVRVNGEAVVRVVPEEIARVPAGLNRVTLEHPQYDFVGPQEIRVEADTNNVAQWKAVARSSQFLLVARDEEGRPIEADFKLKDGPDPLAQKGGSFTVASGERFVIAVSAPRRENRDIVIDALNPGEKFFSEVILPLDRIVIEREERKKSDETYRANAVRVAAQIRAVTITVRGAITNNRRLTTESGKSVSEWLDALERTEGNFVMGNAENEKLIADLRALVRNNTAGPLRESGSVFR